MFREMRLKRQLLSKEDTQKVLYQGTSGVLAVSGDDDYPYAVPLSYVYDGHKIYFHGAKAGHKLDSIVKNPKASFCVIDKDQIVPDEYTTYFRSVIVFGEIQIIEEVSTKRKALELLGRKYSPGLEQSLQEEINRAFDRTCVIELKIKQMTGKQGIELTRSKTN